MPGYVLLDNGCIVGRAITEMLENLDDANSNGTTTVARQ
jgi:hypothetical protein